MRPTNPTARAINRQIHSHRDRRQLPQLRSARPTVMLSAMPRARTLPPILLLIGPRTVRTTIERHQTARSPIGPMPTGLRRINQNQTDRMRIAIRRTNRNQTVQMQTVPRQTVRSRIGPTLTGLRRINQNQTDRMRTAIHRTNRNPIVRMRIAQPQIVRSRIGPMPTGLRPINRNQTVRM